MPVAPDLLGRVVDHVPSMLAYWDAEQRCQFANSAYRAWFGRDPATMIGVHISELLGPTLYELNRPHIEGALRGEPQEFERAIPDPAGGPARHSLACYIPDSVGGVVRGFFVLVSDVSEIKRAQLALEESRVRLAGIVSILPIAIVSIDRDQQITMFSTGAEKVFGHAQAEALGRPLTILIPERLRAGHAQHVAAFIGGPDTARAMGERRATIIGLRKDGEEFPAEAAISKLSIDGRTLLTVSLRDITDRKADELEQQILAEAGAVMTASLDYTQTLDAIAHLVTGRVAEYCVIDLIEDDARSVRRMTMVHADPAKADLCARFAALDLDREHVLGRTAMETRQPHLYEAITSADIASIAKDEVHRALLEELGPRCAIVAPLVSPRGVLGTIVFGSTRPGRFRARDVALAAELARRAALAIDNARMYDAATRATRARDEVLGIVAHDVRSPLNSILLAATTLRRQALGDKADRWLDVIARSVARANRLIEDLLDVTRIDAGALSVVRERVAVRQLVGDAVGSQELIASTSSIELRTEVAADLPELWADDARLLQVLENLVGNAIKFTPVGGCITIAAAPREREIVFSVADTGAGIPAEHLPHVFDRFWQADRRERRGAGLGLPICKGIVDAHGGQIWVESALGRGTTFFFTIPTFASQTR